MSIFAVGMKILFKWVILFLNLFLFFSCNHKNGSTQEEERPSQAFNVKKVKEQFVTANQLLMQKETDNMDAYERSHKLNCVKTNSGIRYFVYAPSSKGDSIKKGMLIKLKYKLYLLDGTLCYSSEKDGIKTFVLEQEEIESGIHKGLQYLKKGDKAILLIPSPLAHGLLGDFNKIPPQMPIVYDVEVN